LIIDTSRSAWEITKPKLGKIHTRVFKAILKYPSHTTAELGLILDISTQTMAGRPGELLTKGLVKRVEQRKCAVTNNTAWTWCIK